MGMNRAQRRASDANGAHLQRLPWNAFEDHTATMRNRSHLFCRTTKAPDQVWLNNKYTVQCFHGERQLGHAVTRAMIRRNDSKAIHSWSDMQRIKNELFGPEARAFEMFPRESELVDVANIYWMFVIV